MSMTVQLYNSPGCCWYVNVHSFPNFPASLVAFARDRLIRDLLSCTAKFNASRNSYRLHYSLVCFVMFKTSIIKNLGLKRH